MKQNNALLSRAKDNAKNPKKINKKKSVESKPFGPNLKRKQEKTKPFA